MQLPDPAHLAYRDQDIVELLHDGAAAAAFALLAVRYERKLHGLCCALLRDRGLAEDVAQESLLRIWQALDRYDGRASLSTWIYAVTRNRCLTALERRRAAERLIDSHTSVDGQDVVAEPLPVEDPAIGLRGLVDSLPDRYRRTLTLYYYEERSVTETAQMLGLPENTVKTNLSRARALLLDRLRHLGLADPAAWLSGT